MNKKNPSQVGESDLKPANQKKKFVILLIEDYKDAIMIYKYLIQNALGEDATVLVATTLHDAENTFQKEKECLSVVIMDGCLGGGHALETLPLIRMIKESSPSLPIIAASNQKEYRKQMMNAGCHFNLADRLTLPQILTATLIKS
jgi:CheY-like chemotaxis protein